LEQGGARGFEAAREFDDELHGFGGEDLTVGVSDVTREQNGV
jgi:hypothetical protein